MQATVYVQIFEGCNFCGPSKCRLFAVLFSRIVCYQPLKMHLNFGDSPFLLSSLWTGMRNVQTTQLCNHNIPHKVHRPL